MASVEAQARRHQQRWIAVAVVLTLAVVGAGAGLAWAWPRLYPSPLARGRVAYERGDWRTSADLARQVLKEQPGDADAMQLLARSAGRLGNDDSAQALYNRLGVEAMEPEDLVVLAHVLLHKGLPREARTVLEAARAKDANHAEALDELSRMYATHGELAAANDLAERVTKRPGWEARGWLRLGLLRGEMSDPSGASEALSRALGIDPELKGSDQSPAMARKRLARARLQLDKPAEARQSLEAIPVPERDAEVSWLLSRALLREGRTKEAVAALKDAGDFAKADPMRFEPAPYVGASACADCHPAIHRAVQGSRHARTFFVADILKRLPLPDRPIADPSDPSVSHMIDRDGDRVRWETREGRDVARATVDFAFGSGDRGVTPVGRDEAGRFRELRLSRYGDRSDWDVTTGHPPHPRGAKGHLGEVLSDDDLRRCLSCHTTDFRAARDRVAPLSAEHGIGCERCHGPGGNHLLAVAADFPDPAIARPRLASASQITALCASCHAPPNQPVRSTDPSSIRFQGVTLTWSRCYKESGGGLSCVTCHDPHRDATTDAASYERQCLACHAAEAPEPSRATRHAVLAADRRRVPCPVNPTRDCLKCHMPVVSGAVPHTTFTDHYIRVHETTTSAGD